MTSHVTPVSSQFPDYVPAVNNDPCLMPCKSARGDDDTDVTNVTSGVQDVAITHKVLAPASDDCETTADPAAVSDNEPDVPAQASAPGVHDSTYAGSKAEADMAYAEEWLASNPEILARVREVLKKYDAKFYQRTTSSNVPFWRNVLRDLVGKAGHAAPAPPGTSTAASAAATDAADPMLDVEPADGQNDDDSFFTVDLARVIVQMAKFRRHLPRLQPHYAMKCNNSIPIIAMISALGGSFDCASKQEFCTILDNGFQTAENIIFAHPCKMINNIQAANRRGVHMVTFDNEEEVEKLHKHMPKAQAVLRIATDDSAAVCEFSSKFGCPMSYTQTCLERATQLGISVVGVSFHVGSGNSSPDAYFKALRDARDIFDRAEALGHDMRLLDIGGGFSGSDPKPNSTAMGFEQIAAFVRPVIDELFPPHVHVIAEPGRYFAESPYAIAMCIHSKRKITKRDGVVEHQYYTSDGKYGAFNCMLYDHQEPGIHVLHPDAEAAERTTTIFGPTCDGVDWIMKQQKFPGLDVGDWIFAPDFGAYTVAAGSQFNGFATRRIEFISSIDVFAL